MLNDRRLYLIYAIILFDVIVGSAIAPIMPEFVKGLPKPQLWLSLGTAVFLGIQLFSAPLLGKLSDSFGRRPIFRLSALGTFLADTLLLPVRAWGFFGNRLTDGITNGMYATVRSAITDISPKEHLFRNMGIEGTIVSFGFVLGPMVAGIVLTAFNVAGPDQATVIVRMAVILSAVNILLTFLLGETHHNRTKADPAQLRAEVRQSLNVAALWRRLVAKDRTRPGILILILMQNVLMMSQGYYNYFVTFASLSELRMDARAIAYFFMYFGLLSVFINFIFYAYLADRINQRRWVIVFAIIGVFVHLAYANVGSSLVWLYIVITIDCLTISLIWGLLEGLLAHLTTDEDRGEIFGINQALNGFASLVTTLVFGGLSLIDLRLPFYWFAVCMGVVGWLAWRRYQKQPVAEPDSAVL